MLEVAGIQAALLDGCVCKHCLGGPVEFHVDLYRRSGLVTHPFLFCTQCNNCSPIISARVVTDGKPSRKYDANVRSVLANKCIGGNHSNLVIFNSMMDLPPPVSISVIGPITPACFDMLFSMWRRG